MSLDHTHNPSASSWVEGADAHAEFPVQNLPFGVFKTGVTGPRLATAIGDYVLDLAVLGRVASLDPQLSLALQAPSLNALFARPQADRVNIRHCLFALLTNATQQGAVEPYLHRAEDVNMCLPAQIGDYTDFYVGIHHATNIGKLLRPYNPLLPNYKHVPIGYHGRASSIRVSGTDVLRPQGQSKRPDDINPLFGPSTRLDYELELGVWIADENALGVPVPIGEAGDRVAGLCLLNDWSARDFQAWEYQPLGPFLAKNFLTSVSPWVITGEALAPFRCASVPRPDGDPAPLPYLWDKADQAHGGFAIELTVSLASNAMRVAGLPPVQLSHGPASNMYWTVAQMIAHHTSNGCNLRPGDLLGTGTISGAELTSAGSLMEISQAGKTPITLPTGDTRTFLQDGDEVIFQAKAAVPGRRSIGFGACTGTVRGAQ